jgi:D-glycero-alpha-D-manno-heptose 1-phosphate guanylyltransferase
MNSDAVILAGGLGTRLSHLIPDLPKPMAHVNGKPFLEILLEQLSSYNFKRIIFSVGHKT